MKYQLLVTLSDGTSLRQDENEKKEATTLNQAIQTYQQYLF